MTAKGRLSCMIALNSSSVMRMTPLPSDHAIRAPQRHTQTFAKLGHQRVRGYASALRQTPTAETILYGKIKITTLSGRQGYIVKSGLTNITRRKDARYPK